MHNHPANSSGHNYANLAKRLIASDSVLTRQYAVFTRQCPSFRKVNDLFVGSGQLTRSNGLTWQPLFSR